MLKIFVKNLFKLIKTYYKLWHMTFITLDKKNGRIWAEKIFLVAGRVGIPEMIV